MSNEINTNDLLLEIKEYIERIIELLPETIESTRINGVSSNIVELIEGLEYCNRALILTQSIDIDKDKFKGVILEILEGIENQDYSLVADIMEYEILEIVKDLNEKLQNI